MRISWLLGASALLTIAQANSFDRRQNGSDGDEDSSSLPVTSNPGPTSSSTDDNGGGGQDVTTTVTTTVTPKGSQSTKFVTISTVSTRVVTNTKTERITDTVTSDVELATDIVYSTTTVAPNAKRYAATGPITAAPEPTGIAQRNVIEKRETITEFETVTADGDGDSVTTSTITKSTVIVSPTETTVTVHVTKYANAKSTTTITSVETDTASGQVTSTGEPNPGNNNGNKDSSGGLSTGAKAGIGAGIGGAALIAILLGVCCFWRRKRNQPKAYPDLMDGASVVPVGGPSGSTSNRPMTHNSASTAGYLAPGRAPTNTQPSPEGYRGTARGDGRAGYAKPEAYGAAYNQAPSRSTTTATGHASRHSGGGADSLPEHPHPGGEMRDVPVGGLAGVSPMTAKTTPSPQPGAHQQYAPPPSHNAVELGSDNANAAKWHNNNAAEIDSQPVMSHQSGPVYEME